MEAVLLRPGAELGALRAAVRDVVAPGAPQVLANPGLTSGIRCG